MITIVPSSLAFFAAFLFATSFLWTFPEVVRAATSNYIGSVARHYHFDIRLENVTRLCHTKSLVTVNGKFPGPRVMAREGDRLLVKVVNHVPNNISINGLPGPLYSCSSNGTFRLKLKPGKTYLLRLINAAMNDELFFSIANHSMTIVEADATYVKPFKSNIIVIGPGQTTNVLLKTKPRYTDATFFMLTRPYFTGKGTFDNSTLAGTLEYEKSPITIASDSPTTMKKRHVFKPRLPPINAMSFVANFNSKFRSLNSAKYPSNVPQNVDKSFFFTVSLGSSPCPRNQTCQGPNNRTKFAASMNNISFALPSVAILQQHFLGKPSNGVYSTDFPVVPMRPFDYTGTPLNNTMVSNGTKVVVVPYNTRVQVALQDTSILGAESHPLHLHGFNFYVVGQGFGNFNPSTDPANFNLVDPVERNTVGVPSGWVAIRFLADNPGVWLMHCHFDVHMSWGLMMVWIVNDGELPHQKLPPPPVDLPKC